MSEDADSDLQQQEPEENETCESQNTINENKKKYQFIEDLPGVGPATAGKLRELGYHTVESLAMATSRELDPVGVSEKKAFQIIEAARSSIGIAFIRADELFKMRKNVARLTSGSKALDKILDGGLETQTITEFYGEAYTSDHQMFLLENADEIIKANNIKLIIVDSLTAHFRSEYIGREMLASRQQKLNKHMHKLIALARAFNAVAVVTNQVMAKPDQFFGDATHPLGGNIVGHTSNTRIYLRRASHGPIRIARLVSSPYLPDGEEILKVTENGIEDVSEEEKADKASRGR